MEVYYKLVGPEQLYLLCKGNHVTYWVYSACFVEDDGVDNYSSLLSENWNGHDVWLETKLTANVRAGISLSAVCENEAARVQWETMKMSKKHL